MRPHLHVVDLCRMNYSQALKVQREVFKTVLEQAPKGVVSQKVDFSMPDARISDEANAIAHISGAILLVEHDPVYTIGLRSKKYTSEDETKLKSLGADFFRTDRGGLITFHGPGQLVAYPILNLKAFKIGIRDYICRLQTTLIRTCRHFGIKAKSTENTGVWVDDERKIAAIGVHCSRFVTTHGIALNCDVDLSWFDHIVACGIEGKTVTSISKEIGRIVTIAETTGAFLRAFQTEFDCELLTRNNLTISAVKTS